MSRWCRREERMRKTSKLLFPTSLLVALLATGCLGVPGSIYSNNEDANKLYAQGRYTDALDIYRDAQVSRPDLPNLDYNAGTALHKLGEYGRALPQLQRALSAQDPKTQSITHFNMGNNLYMLDQLPAAIEEYKKTLRITPDDVDAKHNLEYLQSLLAKQQPPQAQPSEGDGDQGDEQQTSPNTQGGANRDSASGNQGNSQQSQQMSKEEASKLQQDIRKMLQDAGPDLTIDEALRILDTLREREQDVRESVNWDGSRSAGGASAERDW
ncbi:MAG: tetratricopeptide repeat protein [Dehalococcoidia bacterium]|nr:tetratricopeptide repeat protein [Dehalococcoidia bacterium]